MKKEKDIINHEHTSQGLTSFSEQSQNLIKNLLGKKGLVYIDILKNWSQIVGEDLASHSLPERIDFQKDARTGGTLHLIVSAGAFALEAAHKTPLIIEKINTYFGYNAVDHIKITQSGLTELKNDNINIADIDKKKLVSEDEQNYIDSIVEKIADEDLKQKLRSLAQTIIVSQKKEN